MMFLNPQSKLLKTQIVNLLQNQQTRLIVSKDYNDFTYKVSFNVDRTLSISIKCFNFEELFAFSGQYMLKKYYADYITTKKEDGFDLTITFDSTVLKEVPPKPKQATQEEQVQYKDAVASINVENQVLIEKVATEFSTLRRNFYAAAYEQTFDSMLLNYPVKPFKQQARSNETVYIVPQEKGDSVSIYYEITMEDNVDRVLGNLILTEMVEAKRHVKNAPSIVKTTYATNELQVNFPEVNTIKKSETTTLINITLFTGQHIQGNYSQCATLLQGLRQYLHYHVHSSKTYLHTRIIRRIQAFQRSLFSCQFQPDDDKKVEDEKEGTTWKK